MLLNDARQIDLANLLRVSRPAITQKLARNSFSTAEIAELADFFGVSTDFLLGREDASLEVE